MPGGVRAGSCATHRSRGGRSPGHVGDEVRHTPAVEARSHRAGVHPRVPTEHRGDLGRLDAGPANLHLPVQSPQELEAAVGAIARDVARAVHARTGPDADISGTNRAAVSAASWR